MRQTHYTNLVIISNLITVLSFGWKFVTQNIVLFIEHFI